MASSATLPFTPPGHLSGCASFRPTGAPATLSIRHENACVDARRFDHPEEGS
jgi:hypothetical protein